MTVPIDCADHFVCKLCKNGSTDRELVSSADCVETLYYTTVHISATYRSVSSMRSDDPCAAAMPSCVELH